MKYRFALVAAAFAAALSGPSVAAPAVPAGSHKAAVVAEIPFDPPLGDKVRYRWEKSVLKDGKTDLNWSVDDYLFEQFENGFRLTVTPVSSGSNESDPLKLALMKRLEELTRRPFVLRISEIGEIESLEDADFYWETIFQAIKEEIAKDSAKKQDAAMHAVMENVLGIFQRMPPEARQALLTESIQPAIEFANTRTEVGKPVISSVETPSPFGGILKRDVTISLAKVADGRAFLALDSVVPRAELDRLVQAFLKQLTSMPAERRSEGENAIASLKRFQHETKSEYEVSLDDGLLLDFQSSEVVEVNDKNSETRKVTTRRLTRIDER
jgi:hypothetical protein